VTVISLLLLVLPGGDALFLYSRYISVSSLAALAVCWLVLDICSLCVGLHNLYGGELSCVTICVKDVAGRL